MIFVLLYGVMILSLTTSQPANDMSLQVTSSATTTQPTPVSSCPLGCISCSKWNGCLECSTNFTWHVKKKYMRKTGMCLRECPTGYFKREFLYAPGRYKCVECKAQHCEKCASQDFCDDCQYPYKEYRGSCILQCPDNLYHSKYRKDCFERVDCLVSGWSDWSQCMRQGQTCGYKWGSHIRNRTVLQSPSPNGSPCTELTQSQRCKLEQRFCSVDNAMSRGGKSHRKRHKNKGRKRTRCRLLKRSGKPCKKRYNSPNKYPPPPPNDLSYYIASNASAYFNYYKQSAELLKLLHTRRGKDKKLQKTKSKGSRRRLNKPEIVN